MIGSKFTPKVYQHYGSLAQLVEQRPEEPCVTGSSPVGATKKEPHYMWGFFYYGHKTLQASALRARNDVAEGSVTGSSPVGATTKYLALREVLLGCISLY